MSRPYRFKLTINCTEIEAHQMRRILTTAPSLISLLMPAFPIEEIRGSEDYLPEGELTDAIERGERNGDTSSSSKAEGDHRA